MMHTGSRLRRVRFQRTPAYNEQFPLHLFRTYDVLAMTRANGKEQECIPVGCVLSAAVAMSIPACTGQGGRGCIPACTGQGGVYPSMHWAEGGCLPGRCLLRGGCLPRGVCLGGVCPEGGVCTRVSAWGCLPGAGVCPGGCVYPSMH